MLNQRPRANILHYSRCPPPDLLCPKSVECRNGSILTTDSEVHDRDVQSKYPGCGGCPVSISIFVALSTNWLFRYFSYGAAVQPSIWSAFRLSHRILEQNEGPNDGLVSVSSSRWGGESGYKGTLMGVSHLDLINWTNRLKWIAGEVTGNKRKWARPYQFVV